MVNPIPALEPAEHVATIARELAIETAVIGAIALAAHHYVRGTTDIDLATAMDPWKDLTRLQARLVTFGLQTALHLA